MLNKFSKTPPNIHIYIYNEFLQESGYKHEPKTDVKTRTAESLLATGDSKENCGVMDSFAFLFVWICLFLAVPIFYYFMNSPVSAKANPANGQLQKGDPKMGQQVICSKRFYDSR